jgi:hypothetical protein
MPQANPMTTEETRNGFNIGLTAKVHNEIAMTTSEVAAAASHTRFVGRRRAGVLSRAAIHIRRMANPNCAIEAPQVKRGPSKAASFRIPMSKITEEITTARGNTRNAKREGRGAGFTGLRSLEIAARRASGGREESYFMCGLFED